MVEFAGFDILYDAAKFWRKIESCLHGRFSHEIRDWLCRFYSVWISQVKSFLIGMRTDIVLPIFLAGLNIVL